MNNNINNNTSQKIKNSYKEKARHKLLISLLLIIISISSYFFALAVQTTSTASIDDIGIYFEIPALILTVASIILLDKNKLEITSITLLISIFPLLALFFFDIINIIIGLGDDLIFLPGYNPFKDTTGTYYIDIIILVPIILNILATINIKKSINYPIYENNSEPAFYEGIDPNKRNNDFINEITSIKTDKEDYYNSFTDNNDDDKYI